MGHKQKAEGTQNWGSCFSTDLGDSCQGGRRDLGLRKWPARLDMRDAVASPHPAPLATFLTMGFIAEVGGAS